MVERRIFSNAFSFFVCALVFVLIIFAVSLSFGERVARLFYVPRSVLSSTLPVDLLWSTELEGVVTQPPLLTDKQAVVVTHNLLFALDIHSGEIQWQYPLQGIRIETPLFIVNDLVIVGHGRALVTAISLVDGRLRWEKQLAEESYANIGGVVVVNDLVIVVGQPSIVQALSLEDGTRQWKINTFRHGIRDRGLNIALYEDRVYIIENQTFIVDPTSGEIIEKIDVDLYGMQQDGRLLLDKSSVCSSRTFERLFDIEPPPFGCGYMNLPYAIDQKSLYGAGDCNGVYRISRLTGRIGWEYKGNVRASPPLALFDENVYALFEDGEIHAISTIDGAQQGVLKTSRPLADFVTNGLLTSLGITTNGEVMVVTFHEPTVLGLGIADE